MTWSQISAEAAARAMQQAGAVYVDVRTLEEFELGHPAGAFHVPWQIAGALNPDFVRVVSRAFAPDRVLIVGCQSGQRSGPACAALFAAGLARVVEQHGGYAGKRDGFGRVVEPGWQRAGLPIAMSAGPGRSYRELCERTSEA